MHLAVTALQHLLVVSMLIVVLLVATAIHVASVMQTRAVAPVSYTHLDVYKRQPMNQILQRMLAAKYVFLMGALCMMNTVNRQ